MDRKIWKILELEEKIENSEEEYKTCNNILKNMRLNYSAR